MTDFNDNDRKMQKPQIIFTQYSPYMVTDMEHLEDSKGNELPVQPVMSLCRCGASKRKPYCDGSHSRIGFSGEKESNRVKDKVRNYVGKEMTIHDNRGVCSHDTSCIKTLPSVFRKDGKLWIDPDGATVKEIIETIEQCPSGALSYTIGSRRYQDLDREPKIKVAKNGPLEIQGGIILKDDMRSTPEAKEHYTLCRCGASKNKPLCDGLHWDVEFEDGE